MQVIGTIRMFSTKHFTVIVDAVEDDIGLDDLGFDKESQEEISHKLETGELILFCARARVLCDDVELSRDYLGGCVYERLSQFEDHRECGAENKRLAAEGKTGRCGSYFSDMVSTVCTEARQHLNNMPKVRS